MVGGFHGGFERIPDGGRSSGAAAVLAALIGVGRFSAKADDSPRANAGPGVGSKSAPPAHAANPDALELSDAQLGLIDVGVVSEQAFRWSAGR